MSAGALVGREDELARLAAARRAAAAGRGSLLLLAGEAGTGKTRLAEAALGADDAVAFTRGAANPGRVPYGPLTAAIRGRLRHDPGALAACGPLRAHLALLLPELGDPVTTADRGTLHEAIRCGLQSLVAAGPVAMLLDDLQWSDEATLEVLAALAPWLADVPLLVVAAYRSDELPQAHPLRRLRHDLRRDRVLDELALAPLGPDATTALVAQLLGEAPSPRLAAIVHDRTGGLPFFVEELTTALRAAGRVRPGPAGAELALDGGVPLPQTVRDALLVRVGTLPEPARAAADVAAVLGTAFDLELLDGLVDEAGLAELVAGGLLVEGGPGQVAFRQPLAREAIYADVPWLRRRTLHRRLAEALQAAGADPARVAEHWLAARDTQPALAALRAAIDRRAAVHAHRDAAALGRQALDLWPEGERGAERVAVVERLAQHAELAGDLAEAARAQREVVAARRAEGSGRALADAERRIAGIYALQGDRPRALAARTVAADAFAAGGLPGEAAAERLVAANYLQAAGRHSEAIATARQAGAEALRAERTDLRVRALALEGVAVVKGGTGGDGRAMIRDALRLALRHELTVEAAEAYQRLGSAYEVAGDYGAAREALGTAIGLCERGDARALEAVCLGCMAYVLRELGDWDQVESVCAGLVAPGVREDDSLVGDGILGAVHLWRGRPEAARPLLERCLRTATRLDVVSMQCDSATALAMLAAAEGDAERALELCRLLLARWTRSEDRHYAVWGLRWAAGWLATAGHGQDARACAEALSSIAAAGHPDALAALACALGETALADGDAAVAAQQLGRAVDLHEGLDIPYERAQILLRAGLALLAAGEREPGLERLAEAHRTAAALGAAPLAAEVAAAVTRAGAPLEELLGRRAVAEHRHAGLSPRELEVVRLVAAGHTNREIAERLVLSTRTVDMHVRSILAKLRCRTRTEAAGRAADLGLLAGPAAPAPPAAPAGR